MRRHLPQIFVIVLLVLIGTVFIFQISNAALVTCGRTTGTAEEMKPCGTCDLLKLGSNLVDFVLFYIVPAVATLLFLAAGFLILLGGASPGQIKTGQGIFRTTVVGLIIIFTAWLITNTLLKTLAGDSDISNSWYKIECKEPVPQVQKYSCQNGTCALDQAGEYTTENCDNKCQKTVVISNVQVTDITPTTANVKWQTDIESTSQVQFGDTAKSTTLNSTNTKDHSVALNGLTPETTYAIRAVSSAGGYTAKSSLVEFKTAAGAGNVLRFLTDNNLNDAAINQDYSAKIEVAGGKPPYRIFLDSQSVLPAGLKIDSGGNITGKPTKLIENGSDFKVLAEDNSDPKATASRLFRIKVLSGQDVVTISNVRAINITSDATIITWKTDKPSTSQVEYGTSSSFGSATAIDNSQKTDHSVSLTGLSANTNYNYRAKSSLTGYTAVSSTNTFKTLVSSETLTPTPTPTGGSVTCMFSGLNLCKGNSSSGCSNSSCNQYAAAISRQANGVATANVLKAFMETESSCNINAATGTSYGLMQLSPAPANKYKVYCGVTENITGTWLTNSANAEKSICIAAAYINAIAQSQCGSSIRNLYAGYNGGEAGSNSGCAPSVSCAGEINCDGEPVRKWECLYDDKAHTICNGDSDVRLGFNQTKQGATRIIYCAGNPGF